MTEVPAARRETAQIVDLSHDGRGVARLDGKAVFLHGGLPGENVELRREKRRRDFDEGTVLRVLEAAADRVEPRCPWFGRCGGCALQHLAPEAQLRAKEKMLLDNLQRIGQVSPAQWIPALCGPQWGYRRRARLGVKDVTRRGRVLVGFRERNGPHVTDMRACHTLVPDVGQRLEALSELVASLSIRRRLPQIEVAAGDNATALVLRHLSPLASRDLDRLRQFESETGLWIHLQPKGPDTVRPLSEAAPPLWYELPKHGVRIRFLPTDFIQVNAEVNAGMVDLALEWLDPRPGESVLDLFSGLGNFGLPIARRGARVTAVEGERGLVRRGEENARENGLAEEMSWHATNLFEDTIGMSWAQTSHDKVLLDPPRSGAREVIPRLAPMGVRRIVYVSCHPATLARDAAQLVHEEGYRLEAAGAMDMFPHTAHVEAIAVFERSRVET
jgi:23S rRNA (uracil1939-C5)-methyltransferase